MDYVDDYLFDGVRVLLGEDGSVIDSEGKPVLQYVWGRYWVNNHAHILKAAGAYPLEAIYVALRRTSIGHIVTGAVQMKISQRNLKKLEVSMPDPGSLDYLQPLFAAYRNLCEESRRLVTLRDALLPKLMTGEIDVSELNLTQLNSHLAETLRPFGCHIPAIQKTGQLALLRTAPYPRPSRYSANQRHSPTYQISRRTSPCVWASLLGRNPRRLPPPAAVAHRLRGVRSGIGRAI